MYSQGEGLNSNENIKPQQQQNRLDKKVRQNIHQEGDDNKNIDKISYFSGKAKNIQQPLHSLSNQKAVMQSCCQQKNINPLNSLHIYKQLLQKQHDLQNYFQTSKDQILKQHITIKKIIGLTVEEVSQFYENQLMKQKKMYQMEIDDMKGEISRQYKLIGLMKQEVEDLMVMLNQQQQHYNRMRGAEQRERERAMQRQRQRERATRGSKQAESSQVQLLGVQNQYSCAMERQQRQRQRYQRQIRQQQQQPYHRSSDMPLQYNAMGSNLISGLQTIIEQGQTDRTLMSLQDEGASDSDMEVVAVVGCYQEEGMVENYQDQIPNGASIGVGKVMRNSEKKKVIEQFNEINGNTNDNNQFNEQSQCQQFSKSKSLQNKRKQTQKQHQIWQKQQQQKQRQKLKQLNNEHQQHHPEQRQQTHEQLAQQASQKLTSPNEICQQQQCSTTSVPIPIPITRSRSSPNSSTLTAKELIVYNQRQQEQQQEQQNDQQSHNKDYSTQNRQQNLQQASNLHSDSDSDPGPDPSCKSIAHHKPRPQLHSQQDYFPYFADSSSESVSSTVSLSTSELNKKLCINNDNNSCNNYQVDRFKVQTNDHKQKQQQLHHQQQYIEENPPFFLNNQINNMHDGDASSYNDNSGKDNSMDSFSFEQFSLSHNHIHNSDANRNGNSNGNSDGTQHHSPSSSSHSGSQFSQSLQQSQFHSTIAASHHQRDLEQRAMKTLDCLEMITSNNNIGSKLQKGSKSKKCSSNRHQQRNNRVGSSSRSGSESRSRSGSVSNTNTKINTNPQSRLQSPSSSYSPTSSMSSSSSSASLNSSSFSGPSFRKQQQSEQQYFFENPHDGFQWPQSQSAKGGRFSKKNKENSICYFVATSSASSMKKPKGSQVSRADNQDKYLPAEEQQQQEQFSHKYNDQQAHSHDNNSKTRLFLQQFRRTFNKCLNTIQMQKKNSISRGSAHPHQQQRQKQKNRKSVSSGNINANGNGVIGNGVVGNGGNFSHNHQKSNNNYQMGAQCRKRSQQSILKSYCLADDSDLNGNYSSAKTDKAAENSTNRNHSSHNHNSHSGNHRPRQQQRQRQSSGSTGSKRAITITKNFTDHNQQAKTGAEGMIHQQPHHEQGYCSSQCNNYEDNDESNYSQQQQYEYQQYFEGLDSQSKQQKANKNRIIQPKQKKRQSISSDNIGQHALMQQEYQFGTHCQPRDADYNKKSNKVTTQSQNYYNNHNQKKQPNSLKRNFHQSQQQPHHPYSISSPFVSPSSNSSVDSMLRDLQSHNKFLVGSKKIQLRYQGDKKDGHRQGTGTLYFSNGLCYEGEFKAHARSGYGVLKFNHIQLYSGDWFGDELNGQGKIRNCAIINKKKTNNTNSLSPLNKWISYCGSFKQNRFDGEGTLHLQGGEKFIGKFQKGTANGQGSLFKKNGDIELGIWKNNILVESFQEWS